jgi:hypothetical protein
MTWKDLTESERNSLLCSISGSGGHVLQEKPRTNQEAYAEIYRRVLRKRKKQKPIKLMAVLEKCKSDPELMNDFKRQIALYVVRKNK